MRELLRLALIHKTALPRELASASLGPRGRIHEAYRRAYRRSHFDRFFQPLLRPGGLVFDVGANVGEWTDTFRRLDQRVVAVEPQADVADEIRRRFAGDALVEVVTAAVGADEGEAELFLARTSSEHASMSRPFIEALIADRLMSADAWGSSIRVPLVTLDSLVARHGLPDYVKLDVEGSEPEALAGLGVAPPLVSIEFHRASPEGTTRCLDRLQELGPYEFSLTSGEWLRFAGGWRSRPALERDLDGPVWGNVFARVAS